MRILNLVKYDFYSIFKSPLTYLAILVVSSLIATQNILWQIEWITQNILLSMDLYLLQQNGYC